jgi:hypothetical protein
MLSILLFLIVSAMSAPLEVTQKQDILPTIRNLQAHGPGCPNNAALSFQTKQSATLSFPSFKVLEDGTCLQCAITFELEGTESENFHGINFDLYGRTSLDVADAQSIVFLSPSFVGEKASRKMFSDPTSGVKDFYLRKIINQAKAQINAYVCAIGGGNLSVDKIKIQFADL